MSEFLNRIVENATQGNGACAECPAFTDGRSQRVNPGLGNPDADIAFVTIEPSTDHTELIDWTMYDSWQEYNREFRRQAQTWGSGQAIDRILAPIEGYSFEDVWMADSIKCSPNGSSDEDRPAEFACCSTYLKGEFEVVDPSLLVTLGRLPTNRTLDILAPGVEGLSVRKNAGRILDTDPPVLVSTSWSHSHLDWSLMETWGDGWIESHAHLQDASKGTVIDVVRASLKHFVRHSME